MTLSKSEMIWSIPAGVELDWGSVVGWTGVDVGRNGPAEPLRQEGFEEEVVIFEEKLND